MNVQTAVQDRLYDTIAAVLGVDVAALCEDSSPDSIPSWDSLNHLNLVMALEEEYQLSLTPEDTLAMHSVAAIRAILDHASAATEPAIHFADCCYEHLPQLKSFVARSYGKHYVLGTNDAYFHWQYGAPAVSRGDHFNLRLAFVEDEIVGCLGYIPGDFDIGGRTVSGAWLANWMVDPEKRHLGVGPLLVSEVSRDFDCTLALGASHEARDILVRMGWTDCGNLRRYVHVLDAKRAALVTESGRLDWPTAPRRSGPRLSRGTQIERIDRLDGNCVELWDRLHDADTKWAGTRRTAEFLNWRYADHPQFDYRLFTASTTSGMSGLAIYRIEQARGLPVRIGRLVELVAEPNAETHLLDAVLADAHSQEVALIDFFCASDHFAGVLADYCFLPGDDPVASQIPLLYQPLDRRKKSIPLLADLQNIPDGSAVEHWYVTKSDGDQDRPT